MDPQPKPSDAELDALLDAAMPAIPADQGAIDRVLARLTDGPNIGAMLSSESESQRLRTLAEESSLDPAEAVALEELWHQLGEGLPGLPADPAAMERCLDFVRSSAVSSTEVSSVRASSAVPSSSGSVAADASLGISEKPVKSGGLAAKLGLALVLGLVLTFVLATKPWTEDKPLPSPPVDERDLRRPEKPVVVELPELPELPEVRKPATKPPVTAPETPLVPGGSETVGPIIAKNSTDPEKAGPDPVVPPRPLSEREQLLAMARAEGFGAEDLDLILNLDLIESLDRTQDDVLFSLSFDYDELTTLTEEDLDELSGGR